MRVLSFYWVKCGCTCTWSDQNYVCLGALLPKKISERRLSWPKHNQYKLNVSIFLFCQKGSFETCMYTQLYLRKSCTKNVFYGRLPYRVRVAQNKQDFKNDQYSPLELLPIILTYASSTYHERVVSELSDYSS